MPFLESWLCHCIYLYSNVFLLQDTLKCTANVFCSVAQNKLSMKLLQEKVWKRFKKCSDSQNSVLTILNCLSKKWRAQNKGRKGRKISLQSTESYQSSMDGCVNTTGSLFYGHNSSPSILGLQPIDYGRLNIMWILFVPLAMMQSKSITAH